MKKLIFILAVAASFYSLQSCEELEVSFNDVILEKTISVNSLIPEEITGNNVQSYTFSESGSISLEQADNGNNSTQSLGDYADGLSSVTIQTLEFKILDIAEGKTLNIESLTISIEMAGAAVYTESFTDIQPGVTISALELNPDATTEISDALLNNQKLTLSTSGKVTGNVQSFDFNTKITLDIKADVLDTAKSLTKEI